MKEVINFLTENQIQYLATTDLEGNPKVRPFQFMLENKGKLYFCTANTKKVYEEIQNNSNVEICVSSPNFKWMRLSGEVKFSDDMSIKETILENKPLVKGIYERADNPIFEIFYLENAKAVIADFTNGPVEYTL